MLFKRLKYNGRKVRKMLAEFPNTFWQGLSSPVTPVNPVPAVRCYSATHPCHRASAGYPLPSGSPSAVYHCHYDAITCCQVTDVTL